MVKEFNADPVKAKEKLTRYSVQIADSAVARYWKLSEELWGKYTNSF